LDGGLRLQPIVAWRHSGRGGASVTGGGTWPIGVRPCGS